MPAKGKSATTTAPNANPLTRSKAPKPAKEKAKAKAFFNWTIFNKDGSKTVLRSGKGFAMFENEYSTREEKALIDLAQKSADGSVVINNCQIRIVLNQERGDINASDLDLDIVVPS